jgi:septal ring factor EnvC (AmiA/AmiB activator)
LQVRVEELEGQLNEQQTQCDRLRRELTEAVNDRDQWCGTAANQEQRLQAVDRELDEILSLLNTVVSDSAGSCGEEGPAYPD